MSYLGRLLSTAKCQAETIRMLVSIIFFHDEEQKELPLRISIECPQRRACGNKVYYPT